MNRLFADISNNNTQTVDWHAYRNQGGHVLVGLKASEGESFVDKTFASRAEAAHKAGVWVAAYHFGHPAKSAREQAQFFWSQIKRHFAAKDLAVIDIEVTEGKSNRDIAAWVRLFALYFKQASGHSLVGYSSESFLAGIGSCGIRRWWVAKYGPGFPMVPAGATVWAHQYTNGEVGPQPHHFAGVGNCDGSRLNWATYLRLRLSKPKV